MKYIITLLAVLALALFTTPARAQDPVKVDPKHYKVEFENDQVRVLRIHYGVGEKSVMHNHPDSVAVFLVDQTAKFTYPDGTSEEGAGKAGQTMWEKAGAHLPENVGKGPIDLVLVELKGKKKRIIPFALAGVTVLCLALAHVAIQKPVSGAEAGDSSQEEIKQLEQE